MNICCSRTQAGCCRAFATGRRLTQSLRVTYLASPIRATLCGCQYHHQCSNPKDSLECSPHQDTILLWKIPQISNKSSWKYIRQIGRWKSCNYHNCWTRYRLVCRSTECSTGTLSVSLRTLRVVCPFAYLDVGRSRAMTRFRATSGIRTSAGGDTHSAYSSIVFATRLFREGRRRGRNTGRRRCSIRRAPAAVTLHKGTEVETLFAIFVGHGLYCQYEIYRTSDALESHRKGSVPHWITWILCLGEFQFQRATDLWRELEAQLVQRRRVLRTSPRFRYTVAVSNCKFLQPLWSEPYRKRNRISFEFVAASFLRLWPIRVL